MVSLARRFRSFEVILKYCRIYNENYCLFHTLHVCGSYCPLIHNHGLLLVPARIVPKQNMQIHAGFEVAWDGSAKCLLLCRYASELALNANSAYTVPVSVFKSSHFGPFGRWHNLFKTRTKTRHKRTFLTSNRFLLAPLFVPLGVSTSIAAAILVGEVTLLSQTIRFFGTNLWWKRQEPDMKPNRIWSDYYLLYITLCLNGTHCLP